MYVLTLFVSIGLRADIIKYSLILLTISYPAIIITIIIIINRIV